MQLTIKANDKGNENNLLLKEIGTIQIEKEILKEDTAEIQSKPELKISEVTPEENSESATVENANVESQNKTKEKAVQQELFEDFSTENNTDNLLDLSKYFNVAVENNSPEKKSKLMKSVQMLKILLKLSKKILKLKKLQKKFQIIILTKWTRSRK